jgi:hypothetical protein
MSFFRYSWLLFSLCIDEKKEEKKRRKKYEVIQGKKKLPYDFNPYRLKKAYAPS